MKGKMKKLFALALAAIMVLAMGMTAMAAGNITIDNPQKDASYKAYKIFSVTKSGNNYSYKLDNTSDVYELLKDISVQVQADNGFSITATTAPGVYNAVVTDAPKFAAYLKTCKFAENTGVAGSVSGEKVVIELGNKGEGYYFVNTTNGTLANLNTVEGTALTIYDKNETPEIVKTTSMSDQSVEIGQSVPYSITGKVPSTVGYTKYDYIVTDKMGTGLTFDPSSLVVKIGNTVIYETKNGTSSNTAPADGLTVTTVPGTRTTSVKNDDGTFKTTDYDFMLQFDMAKFPVATYPVGTEITIQYNATVNKDAVKIVTGTEDPLKNVAHLEYSKNPDSTETDKTPESSVDLYTAKIVIDKVDGKDNTTKLQNAKFFLVKDANATEVNGTVTLSDSAVYYKYTKAEDATATAPEKGKVEWVNANGTPTEVTTDNTGAASFEGIEDGTYYLVETAAPAGYNLMPSPQKVTVQGSDTTAYLLTVNATVTNNAGSELPSTGGIGTTIFYVVGGILVAGAGILLITKKRMSKSN